MLSAINMKYIYNNLIVTCIFILLINGDQSENEEKNCIISKDGKNLSDADWENGITVNEILDTTENFVRLLEYRTDYIYWINGLDISGQDYYYLYIDIDEDGGYNYTIETDENFNSYEDHETASEIIVKTTFKCHNSRYRDLKITIPIKDTNNHDPTFLNAPYDYKLPMPLPKGFIFDPKIFGRDVDLTNEKIKFEFDKDVTGFSISSSGRDEKDKKNYPTVFMTTDTIDLEKDISLVLHATDSGVPSRKASTTITITIDQANSHPRFSHPIYIANLTNLDYKKVENTKLQFLENKNVTLNRGFNGHVKFEIRQTSDEIKKHLKLTHSGALGDYGIDTYVELVNITEKFLRQQDIFVVLTAVNYQLEAQTVLRIILPKIPVDVNGSPVICDKQPVEESNSLSGYMMATMILSLVIIGLLVYIGYMVLYKNHR